MSTVAPDIQMSWHNPQCRHHRIAKVHGSKAHQRLLRIYRRNTLPFYRSVRGWLLLMRNAILYGVEQQMIRRRKPILESMVEYKPWKPKTRLGKRMMELRVEQLVERLKVEKAKPPFTDISTFLADWGCIINAGDEGFGQYHMKIYGQTMKLSGQIAELSTTWDVVNRHAVEWAAKNTNKLVTAITNETREALRGFISRGIADGKSMATIGREIRPLVGLNNVQMRAGERLRQKLIDAGAKNIEAKMKRYGRKQLRYRAEMISRTEVSRAMSEGTLEGYGEAGVRYVFFEASADACPVCSFLDGNRYTRTAASGLVPQHPNCRCTLRPDMEPVKET